MYIFIIVCLFQGLQLISHFSLFFFTRNTRNIVEIWRIRFVHVRLATDAVVNLCVQLKPREGRQRCKVKTIKKNLSSPTLYIFLPAIFKILYDCNPHVDVHCKMSKF